MKWEGKMEEVSKFGLMDPFMKVIGRQIRQTVAEDLFMLMGMFIMESGKMTKPMDTASTTIQTVPDMKDTGLRINSMEKAKRSGLTMPATRVSIKTGRNMVAVNSFGLMDQLTPVISLRTIFTDWESTRGQMAGNMTVNGRTTRWMVRVSSHGQMAVNTRVNTSTIKKKAKESSLGQTDANTTVIGRTASSTERVFTIQAKEK